MATLNRSLPFSSIEGAGIPWRYEQSGSKFDSNGVEVAAGVVDAVASAGVAEANAKTEYTALTQAQYDDLAAPVAGMLYLIVG